jgi:hypothetical protein
MLRDIGPGSAHDALEAVLQSVTQSAVTGKFAQVSRSLGHARALLPESAAGRLHEIERVLGNASASVRCDDPAERMGMKALAGVVWARLIHTAGKMAPSVDRTVPHCAREAIQLADAIADDVLNLGNVRSIQRRLIEFITLLTGEPPEPAVKLAPLLDYKDGIHTQRRLDGFITWLTNKVPALSPELLTLASGVADAIAFCARVSEGAAGGMLRAPTPYQGPWPLRVANPAR